MAEVVLRHEIFCTEEDYWNKCVWTREFNEGLYVKTLGFPRYEVQGENDGADVRTRRTFIEPPVGALPGALKKAIGVAVNSADFPVDADKGNLLMITPEEQAHAILLKVA